MLAARRIVQVGVCLPAANRIESVPACERTVPAFRQVRVREKEFWVGDCWLAVSGPNDPHEDGIAAMTHVQDGADSRRKNRIRVRRMVIFGLVAFLIWFAPQIIVLSPLRYVLLDSLAEHYQGAVRYEAAHVGWLRPVAISKVEVFDLDGDVLLTAKQITTEKSLLGLLLSGRDLGTVTVDQPKLLIKIRQDGSNLEDALARPSAPPTSPTSPGRDSQPRQLTVQVVNGSADLVDVRSHRALTASGMTLTVELARPQAAFVDVQVKADIGMNGHPSGDLDLKLSYTPASSVEAQATTVSYGSGTMELETNHLPLLALAPLTERWGVHVDGWCDTRLRGSLQGERLQVTVDAWTAHDLAVRAPLLQDETFQQSRVDLSGTLTFVDDAVSLQAFELRSSVAHLTGSGTLPLATTAEELAPALAAAIRHADQQFSGSIDLPALAATLPRTMHLKEDAQITAGKLLIQIRGDTLESARRLTSRVTATGVTGMVSGHMIPLDAPVDMGVTLRQTDAGLGLDNLFCHAPFLAIEGGGLLTQGQVNLTGDLSQFVQQWGPLLQLDQTTLTGSVQGNLKWASWQPRGTKISGEMLVRDLVVASPMIPAWREPQVKVIAEGHVVSGGGDQLQLVQGKLDVTSATDKVTCTLPQALAETQQPRWLDCVARGDLSRWQARLQPFLGEVNYRLSGRVDLMTQVALTEPAVAMRGCKLTVFDFGCRGEEVSIAEPQIVVQGDCSWNRDAREVQSNHLTLTGTALALRAERLAWRLADNDFRAEGQLGFRGDVQRLSQWLHTADSAPTSHLAGEILGNVTLTHQGDTTQMVLNSHINRLDFYAQDPANPQNPPRLQWSEPLVQLIGTVAYDRLSRTATIEQLEAGANDTARATLTGSLLDPTGVCQVDVQGQVTYDLGRLATRLRPWLGADLELAGQQTRQWYLKGPLFDLQASQQPVQPVSNSLSIPAQADPLPNRISPNRISEQLAGEASIVWDQGKYAGLVAGPGEVQAQLAQGMIAIAPIQVPLSGGQFAARPRILLNEHPSLIVLDKGPVLQNVELSAEMCRGWLKYVAPVMADATEVRGRFSTDLDGAIMPLSSPVEGNVKGRLQVHAAQVGPGPVSRAFLGITQQVATIVRGRGIGTDLAGIQWLHMPEQTVEYQLVNGRIYHRGMQFVGGGEVRIRTTGSVGLDQSLDLVAEIPVLDAWADKSDWLAGLRGQSFRIPVRGTLTDPAVDSRALQQIGKQALQGTANRLLEQGIQRGLQELFGN